jgi:hypothetical protein
MSKEQEELSMIYEDQLPELSDNSFDCLFVFSKLISGVRMFPAAITKRIAELEAKNKKYNKLAKVIESNIVVFNGITHKQFKKKTLREINNLKCDLPDYYVTDVCANCEKNAREFEDRMCIMSRRNIEINTELSKSKDKVRKLEAELALDPWISVENPPEYYKDSQYSASILILDGRQVVIGNYIEGKYEWWSGSFRNTDDKGSQKTITHWMPIPTLPEPKEPTFLPDCKWKRKGNDRIFCTNLHSVNFDKSCDKNCANPEPKEQD